jgi:hypothetical protein
MGHLPKEFVKTDDYAHPCQPEQVKNRVKGRKAWRKRIHWVCGKSRSKKKPLRIMCSGFGGFLNQCDITEL